MSQMIRMIGVLIAVFLLVAGCDSGPREYVRFTLAFQDESGDVATNTDKLKGLTARGAMVLRNRCGELAALDMDEVNIRTDPENPERIIADIPADKVAIKVGGREAELDRVQLARTLFSYVRGDISWRLCHTPGQRAWPEREYLMEMLDNEIPKNMEVVRGWKAADGFILAEKQPFVLPGDVVRAEMGFNQYDGKPLVNIELNKAARDRMLAVTSKNINGFMALMLDDCFLMHLRILEPVPGAGSIRGIGLPEAQAIVGMLNKGATPEDYVLPGRLKILEETRVTL